MEYKKILVSFSNSKVDEHVLLSALDISSKYNANLTLIHLNEKGAGAGAGYFVQYEHRYDEKDLQALVDEKNDQGVPVEILVIDHQPIVETLVEKSAGFDLLIIGHRHMNFMEELISDSTDEKVINRVKCHVLVVPEN